MPANYSIPVINYSISMCPFESGKFGKEGKKSWKFEYLENKKSFLDEIESIFHSFWRSVIWWKNKNLIKKGDTSFNNSESWRRSNKNVHIITLTDIYVVQFLSASNRVDEKQFKKCFHENKRKNKLMTSIAWRNISKFSGGV